MEKREFPCLILVLFLCLAANPCASETSAATGEEDSHICRPRLAESSTIDLGKAGLFKWTCRGGNKKGGGFYIVFIRPSGTYVLLKVPQGRTTFEFTPDAAGMWRWIVINTDPDGTKPDLESEPGFFQVLRTAETGG